MDIAIESADIEIMNVPKIPDKVIVVSDEDPKVLSKPDTKPDVKPEVTFIRTLNGVKRLRSVVTVPSLPKTVTSCELPNEEFHLRELAFAVMVFSFTKISPFEKVANKVCVVTPNYVKIQKFKPDMWTDLEIELIKHKIGTVYVLGYEEVDYIKSRFENIEVKPAKIRSQYSRVYCNSCKSWCLRSRATELYKYIKYRYY